MSSVPLTRTANGGSLRPPVPVSTPVSRSGTISPRTLTTPSKPGGDSGTRVSCGCRRTWWTVAIGTAKNASLTATTSTRIIPSPSAPVLGPPGDFLWTGHCQHNLLGRSSDHATPERCQLDRALDVLGGRVLQLRCRPDLFSRVGHDLRHVHPAVQLLTAPADGQHRLAAGCLRACGQRRDLGGRGLGALGQPAHLVGDHGKAPAGLTRARGLDRRVEGQEGGLV